MRVILLPVAFTAGLALLVCCGCGQQSGVATAEEPIRSPAATAVSVVVVQPVRKTVERATTQPGRIEAFEQTPLYPKVAGYVKEVLGDIGDPVTKNQTLIRLDVPELIDELEQKDALVAQAEAEVSQAAAIVEAANAAVTTAEANVVETEAGTRRVKSDCDRCRSEYARIQELAAKGSVTKKLEEEMLNQLRAAEAAEQETSAKIESAKAALSEAQANVRKTEADRVAAVARVRVARANRARAKTMLGYTEMKAPYDGVITRRSIDTGHYLVSAGASESAPLMVVARIDKVRVFVDVPEMEAAFADIGDPAVVRIQAAGLAPIDAKVTRTSWSLLESNRSLRVEVDVPNSNGRLRPGMYATVTISLERRENAVMLPASAVIRDGNSAFCCVVVENKVERRAVELGLANGKEIEITSGIDSDDIVVLKEAGKLQHGQTVEVNSPPRSSMP